MAHHAGLRPPAGGVELRALPLPERSHAHRRPWPETRRHPDRQRRRVMLIDGTKILAADRATVWNALNDPAFLQATLPDRSEEHTSELQSLMRISYAVFCLQKQIHNTTN